VVVVVVQNAKTFCEFFRTRFLSSNRRQYFGSLLRELGVTSVVVMGIGLNGYLQ
jgi:hypothetical protein